MGNPNVLPLAVAMMAGPAFVAAIIFVAHNLEHDDASLVEAFPFIAATVLIAALPLLAYLMFRGAAERAMPKVRAWMNSKSWLVNILICGLFIALILS